jgi:hypothetical protein
VKIAVQLSGQIRHFKSIQNIYKEQLLDRINGDLIFYTWDSDKPQRVENEGTINEFLDIYKPSFYRIDFANNIFFKRSGLYKNINKAINSDNFCKSPISPHAIFYQSYQRRFCNLLRKRIGQYDLIVVTRPDIIPSEPFDYRIFDYAKDKILIPIGGDWEYGTCDIFAIGPPKLIDIYCNLYYHLLHFANRGVLFHPEHVLKYHLDRQQVPIQRFSYTIHLTQRRMT